MKCYQKPKKLNSKLHKKSKKIFLDLSSCLKSCAFVQTMCGIFAKKIKNSPIPTVKSLIIMFAGCRAHLTAIYLIFCCRAQHKDM